MYRIDEYIPDMLYDSWSTVRDTVIDYLIKVGFLGKGASAPIKGASDAPRAYMYLTSSVFTSSILRFAVPYRRQIKRLQQRTTASGKMSPYWENQSYRVVADIPFV